MKHQLTVPADGTFTGKKWEICNEPGEVTSETQLGKRGYQSPNDYTQYSGNDKNQMTQDGWDGTFVGIKIPSPISMDGDGGGSQLGNFSPVSFDGFNLPNETSGPVGPDFSPSNSQPTNGAFPGFGDAGQGGFGRKG